MLKKLVAATLITATVAVGCEPGDRITWLRSFETHPHLAVRHLRNQHPRIYRHLKNRWRPDTVCRRWAQTALDAGFTKAQWYEPVSRIMYAESRCEWDAYNSQANGSYGHARGLMQIMDGLWPGPCGITITQLYDPLRNLRCAKHIVHEQGWSAWVTY